MSSLQRSQDSDLAANYYDVIRRIPSRRWEEFVRVLLGLSENTIDELKHDHTRLGDQKFKALKEWEATQGCRINIKETLADLVNKFLIADTDTNSAPDGRDVGEGSVIGARISPGGNTDEARVGRIGRSERSGTDAEMVDYGHTEEDAENDGKKAVLTRITEKLCKQPESVQNGAARNTYPEGRILEQEESQIVTRDTESTLQLRKKLV